MNGVEFANSSRTVAHLGAEVPTSDVGLLVDPASKCDLTPHSPGLWIIPPTSVEKTDGLWTPPDGARRFGPGLFDIGDCWTSAAICGGCAFSVSWDDSWPWLAAFLGDGTYRPELAPWYVSEIPESGEFAGVWVMDVQGLDTARVERVVTETVGDGGVAAPHRDATRVITFEALLIGCSNAGVQYGLNWLTCLLRDTNDNVTTKLRYLNAHPGDLEVRDPVVDPGDGFPMSFPYWLGQTNAVTKFPLTFPFRFSLGDTTTGRSTSADLLLREMNGVVLTRSPEIVEQFVSGSGGRRQANVYRVSWDLTALNPHSYLPSVDVPVDWDEIVRQPVNWIHAADCYLPETCADMPVMFAADCVPEQIEVIVTPPPVCGGCLPVGEIDQYTFRVPTMDYAFACRETAVSLSITNNGDRDLTAQFFWRYCNTDIRCEDNQFPLQVTGLPPGAVLHLDGISGRYWVWYDERVRRPVGVVGTPNGAPWRPPVIDRHSCWDFIAQTASTSEFAVSMTLADRGT